ncbi:hypothetical protein [Actinomyces qiguomingii]|uniref:hypothetical protein n=1 Tax=Actinomyces qiguomingii TaxID=2057800 RepID=UPI000CA0752C|nr:hypothetical protein [Actinomyces qiguomingii]
MTAIIARELLHFAVYLAGAFITYYIVQSLLLRERKPHMADLHPPEPTSQGPAYTVGRVIGGLILTGLGAVLLSALAALVIVIWRAVL